MAGNVQPASSVQEIVNAVINNLSNLLRQENAVQTAASNADTRNEVSVTSELNRAFRIPRGSTSATMQAILLSTVASIRAAANIVLQTECLF